MQPERVLNLSVRDSLFDPDRPDDKVVQVRRPAEGPPLYRVLLYLDGPDLPFVSKVTYRLHETFSPDTRSVSRGLANPACKIEIWTWGVFVVVATVEDKQGRYSTISHHLEYASVLSAGNLQYRTM